MSGIVCAVRGGPASQPTIAQAIAQAQQTGLPLYFLYVVDLDFLSHTSSSRVQTISKQMQQMGEFILLTAQTTAAAQGVNAEGVVRHGDVVGEITGLCHEIDADYLILGRPQGREDDEESVFTQDMFKQFVAQIEEQTGARVVLPDGEHV